MSALDVILSLFSGGFAGTGACILDLDTLTQILVVAGALNWGSIAICADNDLVLLASEALASLLGGDANTIDQLIKGLVGIAGVYQLLNLLAPIYGFSVKNYCILSA